MKAIGAMITNPGNINDYLGKVIEKETPPLVAIPTTAGTGSEATQFTIITDTKRNIKMLLKGSYLIPTIAIIDPVFSMTSPKGVTSATGLDALTHAIESYTSKLVQPMSEIFSISAVKKIFNNLLEAYNDGSNIKARTEMSIAALQAGIAFNNSSVTIVHGMSRPIGALFHVPHGLSNAMLLTDCLKFALSGAPDKFCDLAKAIGIYKDGMSDIEAGEAFIKAVEDLCKDLHVQTLEEFGVDKSKFDGNLDKMASDALDSGSPQNTMREVKKEDIISIYKDLWK
jgi:alcohol dehydrogenase class IV